MKNLEGLMPIAILALLLWVGISLGDESARNAADDFDRTLEMGSDQSDWLADISMEASAMKRRPLEESNQSIAELGLHLPPGLNPPNEEQRWYKSKFDEGSGSPYSIYSIITLHHAWHPTLENFSTWASRHQQVMTQAQAAEFFVDPYIREEFSAFMEAGLLAYTVESSRQWFEYDGQLFHEKIIGVGDFIERQEYPPDIISSVYDLSTAIVNQDKEAQELYSTAIESQCRETQDRIEARLIDLVHNHSGGRLFAGR